MSNVHLGGGLGCLVKAMRIAIAPWSLSFCSNVPFVAPAGGTQKNGASVGIFLWMCHDFVICGQLFPLHISLVTYVRSRRLLVWCCVPVPSGMRVNSRLVGLSVRHASVRPRLWQVFIISAAPSCAVALAGGIGSESSVGSGALLWSPSQMVFLLLWSGILLMISATLSKNSAFSLAGAPSPAAPSACVTTMVISLALKRVHVTTRIRPDPSKYSFVFSMSISFCQK